MYPFIFFLSLHGLWDLSSPTRNWTWSMAVKVHSPNHWTTKDSLHPFSFFLFCLLSWSQWMTQKKWKSASPYWENIRANSEVIALWWRIISAPSGSDGKESACNAGVKSSEIAQSCPTLCDHMNCSLPGSSIHGTFEARILEWVAISFSRGSSWPRDQTQVSRIAGIRTTREAMQETWVQSWGWENPLDNRMATHSGILAYRIPWTEEPGGHTFHGGHKEWDRTEPLSLFTLLAVSSQGLPSVHAWGERKRDV